MARFQQEKKRTELFPTRAQAEAWAKSEKSKLKQADFSVRWDVRFDNKREQWQAILQIGMK